MTKTETRDFMSSELVACIAQSLKKLPSHMKIDLKRTKNYISFTEYGIYICFYVTSSLHYSFRDNFGSKENDVTAIEYDKERDKKELKALVKAVFDEILEKLNRRSVV